MKKNSVIIIFTSLLALSFSVQANPEQKLLDRHLYLSVVDQDFDKFQKYLRLGANANSATNGKIYRTSALCESTKHGNEIYLDFLIESIKDDRVLLNLDHFNSPIGCAIDYKNIIAFEKFISMGVDVASIVNPDEPKKIQRTLFDIARRSKSVEILWFIIQRIELSEKQLSRLVKTVEKFGGFEGSKSVQYYEKIANFLVEKGVAVSLKPPAPDPRLFKTQSEIGTGIWLLDRQLYLAVLDKNYENFEKFLSKGANPNADTFNRSYRLSALCEATRIGKESFLKTLVESFDSEQALVGLKPFSAPINCAISYKNSEAFKILVSAGQDLQAVINPNDPKKQHTTLLDIAIESKSPEVILYLVQNIKMSKSQLSKLVLSLEEFSGYDEFKSAEFYKEIADWLEDKGVPVNLATPSTDPRATPRKK